MAAVCVAPTSSASAQTALGRAFQSASIGIGVVHDLDVGALEPFWRAPTAADVRLATPFYAGVASFSLTSGTYAARADAQPDFEFHRLTAGWSAAQSIAAGLDGRLGIQVGAMTMDFDDDETPIGNVEETELLLGLEAALSRRIYRRLGVEMYLTGQRVFTRRPIDLLALGVAGNYTVNLPGLLQEALQ